MTTLKSQMQKEAAESAPDFSPLLHERIMATLRAAPPAPALPTSRRRLLIWPLAAAAALLLTASLLALHLLSQSPRTPNTAAVQLPSAQEISEPVSRLLAALPAEKSFEESKYAYLDQDAKRLMFFLADQIPNPPAAAEKQLPQ